jgi:cell wall-associated NlpC family hydrolase
MEKLHFLIFVFLLVACDEPGNSKVAETYAEPPDTISTVIDTNTTITEKTGTNPIPFGDNIIETGKTTPAELLTFAKDLQGIPYKYGSINPAEGFDCSGFITYVFNHFNIAVPRSSAGFTDVQREIKLKEAKPGDIILYTGTDSTISTVGHMGIITENNNGAVEFIHSTSGKADGVTITSLNDYYMSRFVKVIRIFNQNDII